MIETMAEQYRLLFVDSFKGRVLFNVPMRDYTSLRIGGPADAIAFPKDEADLKHLLSFATSKGFKVYVIGAGSNILVRDGGIRGIVINTTEGFTDAEWIEKEQRVVVGAGVRLSLLCKEASKRGLGGLEFAATIPATVGGAVWMNAGAYGGEMKDVVEGVEIMNPKGKKSFIPKTDIGFGYRRTELPHEGIIVRVHMRLHRAEPESIEQKIEEYKRRRQSTTPVGMPSAGSIFKNPEGMHAGKLIEEAGLKGVSIGGAKISEVHANYIVNTGNAKAEDVLALIALMRDKVFAKTGIMLEPEIKVIGESA